MERLRRRRKSKSYRGQVKSALLRAYESLETNGMETRPSKIGEREAEFLIGELNEGKFNLGIVSRFLVFAANNRTLGDLIAGLPTVPAGRERERTWLEDWERLDLIYRMAMPPRTQTVVLLGLLCGMRRIEILRLQIGDVRGDDIDIRGKGGRGKVTRTVPLQTYMKDVLRAALAEREELIERTRQRHGHLLEVAPELLVHAEGPRILPYGKSWLDELYSGSKQKRTTGLTQRFEARFGKRIRSHDMRRTCGRHLYFHEWRIEEVGEFLGHKDPRTTLLYLGLMGADLRKLIDRISEEDAQAQAEMRKSEEPVSPVDSAGFEPATSTCFAQTRCEGGDLPD